MSNKSDYGTLVLPCSCNSDFQDKKYGNGNRLHNRGPKIKDGNKARCTSCGRTR